MLLLAGVAGGLRGGLRRHRQLLGAAGAVFDSLAALAAAFAAASLGLVAGILGGVIGRHGISPFLLGECLRGGLREKAR